MKLKGEILSPVGSKEMLIAAVRSGADAVYLGAKDFSARRNAENFDIGELKEAVKYCHIRNVKVYLALNILIKEAELESAFLLAQSAYNCGIDGIITEDLGLAKILRKKIPQLPLHASTQMSVHSAVALPILKKLGFTRVVVAREMSHRDLKCFCQKAKELEIEVEVFIHGALCMCMSGQCQLSAFLGSRSGNRGLCAGPCRLPFSAENGTGYDLSLKDLSLLDYLEELSEMGVSSFKIEGRMKRPEYVAAVTAAVRQRFDNGFVEAELLQTIKDVFSRSGFTDGYYTENLGRNMFGIRTKENVLAAGKAYPKLHGLYRNERQSVALSLRAEIKKDTAISLTLFDGKNTACVKGNIPSPAQTKAATEEDVLKSLTKFGSTPYFAKDYSCFIEDGLFVSAGELNALRRAAVEELDRLRGEHTRPLSTAVFEKQSNNTLPKKQSILCRFDNENQIPHNLSGIDGVIYPLECDPQKAPRLAKMIVDIPRGIISEELISERLRIFKEQGFSHALCGNLSAVSLAENEGFEILADTGLNCFNGQTAAVLESINARAVTQSYELELSCKFSSSIPKGIIAYGHVPLMLFKNCPLKNGGDCGTCRKTGVLTDRLGVKFPVRCRMGYSEMLNSLPIWLADRKAELQDFDYLVLYFTNESKERVAEVINAYKNGSPADTKHTRGLYYRGTF